MAREIESSKLRTLLRRAAEQVRSAILDPDQEMPTAVDAALAEERGGAFVTIRRSGRLAGCIGFVESPWPLAETVSRAARSAALEDDRFERLAAASLPELEVEISILSPPEPIEAHDVVVGRHGLILELGPFRGLLLPQVAVEHGLDREAFLDALCHKSGLPSGEWRGEGVRLMAFTAQLDKGSLHELTKGSAE